MNTPRSRTWQRFRQSRRARWSLTVLAALTLACGASTPWTARSMRIANLDRVRQPPSLAEPFGTDDLGRSLLARTLYGGAISLALGLFAAAVSVIIGTTYGLIAGYLGGRIDELMMRLVDLIYALPTILLVMLLAVSVGARLEQVPALGKEWARFVVLAVAIGGVSWLTMARVIRGQVLSLRERPFIEAARAMGVPTPVILWRHVLPNLVGPVVVFAALTVPQAILQESFLSFLGIGIQQPQATWGSLAADGVKALNPVRFDWWLLVFPATGLSVTLAALNLVGDGLRDAFDLRGQTGETG